MEVERFRPVLVRHVTGRLGGYKSEFRCFCGDSFITFRYNVYNGHTKSCGCFSLARTHGMSTSPEYGVWGAMIQRCTNPCAGAYKHYGGRGITMHPSWLSFERFYKDMGARPSHDLSIERLNTNLGYSKENCVWATTEQQSINRRKRTDNKSSCPGVFYLTKSNNWWAYINWRRKRTSLGYFINKEDAIAARLAAELKLHGRLLYEATANHPEGR